MLNSVDYSFNYKFLFRNILIQKLSKILNSFSIPHVQKLVLYFSLMDFETLDDVRIYNYHYFFKFFLGERAFFSGYKSLFNLGKTTLNVKIQLILNKKDVFFSLLFFSNDVLPFLDLGYLSSNYFKQNLNIHVFTFLIKDMNIFVEKKTNIGLFNLKDALHFQIKFLSSEKMIANMLLQNFKIYL